MRSKTARTASDCSAANFYIWSAIRSRLKRPSSGHTGGSGKNAGEESHCRTLDIGANKVVPNAASRAAAFGNLAVMFPMIISPQEVRDAKKIVERLRKNCVKKDHIRT